MHSLNAAGMNLQQQVTTTVRNKPLWLEQQLHGCYFTELYFIKVQWRIFHSKRILCWVISFKIFKFPADLESTTGLPVVDSNIYQHWIQCNICLNISALIISICVESRQKKSCSHFTAQDNEVWIVGQKLYSAKYRTVGISKSKIRVLDYSSLGKWAKKVSGCLTMNYLLHCNTVR